MAWLTAIPDLLTAAGMLLIWLRPDLTGAGWVAAGMTTVLLEFFAVHASGFFAVAMFAQASRVQRSLFLAGLAAVYLLLVAGFAAGLHAWWMVTAFGWLAFGKVYAVWSGEARSDRSAQKQAAMAGWVAGMLCYLGAVFASALIAWPAFGVTPAVIAAAGFTGGGIWEERPYTALAGGVLYFSAMGLIRALIRLHMLRAVTAKGYSGFP